MVSDRGFARISAILWREAEIPAFPAFALFTATKPRTDRSDRAIQPKIALISDVVKPRAIAPTTSMIMASPRPSTTNPSASGRGMLSSKTRAPRSPKIPPSPV